MKVALPATNGKTMSRSGHQRLWMIDKAAMQEAVEELGLRLDVTVRFAGGARGFQSWTYGTHRLRNGGHHITVSSHYSSTKASETLWHELQHAVQTEAWAEQHWPEYVDGGNGTTFNDEAAFARACAHWYRLVYRPANRRSYHHNEYEVDARAVASHRQDAGQYLTRLVNSEANNLLRTSVVLGATSKEDDMAAKTTTTKPAARHIDVLAAIITKQFGGKAKLVDVVEYVTTHKTALPETLTASDYPYRSIRGVISRDEKSDSPVLVKVGPGEFKVKPVKAAK